MSIARVVFKQVAVLTDRDSYIIKSSIIKRSDFLHYHSDLRLFCL